MYLPYSGGPDGGDGDGDGDGGNGTAATAAAAAEVVVLTTVVVVVIADGSGGLVLPLIVLTVVVVVVVVATDKHITLLFKTRSGIKHNAERCSDVSPRSAFCFGRLFLTTHAFRVLVLVLSREKRVLSSPFLPFFLPSSSSLSLRLRLLFCRLFLLAAPF